MQPSLFDTAELPFAVPIDVSPGPAESSGAVSQLKHVANAARFTAANCWVRHACLCLVRQALASVGTTRLARALDERALPFVYALLRTHPQQPDERQARGLLREAFLAFRYVPLQSLGDEVLTLDASDATPAWYPVLGAMQGLWPPARLSTTEADAVLDTPTPTDDAARAHLFWQCYCAWKSQREPNGRVTRARMLMKQLNPAMFAQLK